MRPSCYVAANNPISLRSIMATFDHIFTLLKRRAQDDENGKLFSVIFVEPVQLWWESYSLLLFCGSYSVMA